ncbi:tripartite tricarboxylate transporter substrate binding protein [Xenophilus arseniciresistens]|uniref:Tripartite tricarboxylate transporter substrate binding protein n=1 Tax=Xenophilus arseniciresistens TaxID=1283306 RepID=A0AAE3SZC0_9BURK|nr:tripartite tricarboxylate transporter substrate binding protein [Xenophilus arseniciresistens]MDA7416929.1 tripartite tricarboxylate transporter substrate binding protein [Xenophilus arseniciresistens]
MNRLPTSIGASAAAAVSRRQALLAGAAALTLGPAGLARAADSQAPVRLLVPFTPGTGIDLIARLAGPALSQRLKRPFFVDNKPGASGNIGTQEVVRATPDGSTLLVTVNTVVMNAALYPKLGFDPVKDLAPISLTSWGQLLLVATPRVKFDSLTGLMDFAKKNPGVLNYGSPGAGTPHHLAMELLKSRGKVSLTHISYRGTAPAVTDLLGGQIDVMFLPIHVALQHIKAGKLKALAISSDKPSPLLPEVPPLNTLKIGDLNVDMWYGIFAPAGTPESFIQRVNEELRLILREPEVAKAFEAQGMTPAHSTPQEFQRLVQADARRWGELIRTQGITAE